MPHSNSVFHSVLTSVPWGNFDRLVATHSADKHVRRLSTKAQFVALLYGQLSGAASLREIIGGLSSHAARLYHVGCHTVQRSTLAEANAKRSSKVFSELFASMVASSQRGLRRKLDEVTYLIDSTGLPLSGMGSSWAYFSDKACGAKLHVIYDPDAECPIYAAVTAAKVNDITAAQTMPVVKRATYVFDLGYYDYAWWAKLDEAECRIVTRFKANTPLKVILEQPVAQGGPILSDRLGLLPKRRSMGRKNPLCKPVREIRVKLDTGPTLRILSNDLDASAEEIANLYKRRWQIELFFRWVKQNLKIRHFLGNNENAVRIQIAIALIAYLLLRTIQAAQTTIQSPLEFVRLVRTNLMHRRPIEQLKKPPPKPNLQSAQLSLKLKLI